MAGKVTIVDHPLVQHKLSLMRSTDTGSVLFRALAREVGMLMAFEVTRELALSEETIETPLQPMPAPVLEGRDPVLVAILRAGIGMLDGIQAVLPTAKVGHVGMYRDPKTLEAHEYYFKMPPAMPERDVWLVDPMLATANTAIASTHRVKEARPRSMKFVCLLAAPEGIERFHAEHPDVEIIAAAVDEKLNDKGYILPGLGDAGDRLFGT